MPLEGARPRLRGQMIGVDMRVPGPDGTRGGGGIRRELGGKTHPGGAW